MPIVPYKDSTHRIDVPTATAQDIVTAVGVNKYLAGINTAGLNGVQLCQINSRWLPNAYVVGTGPGPSVADSYEHPAVGQCIDGAPIFNVPFTVGSYRIALPDGLDRIYCDIDVSFIQPDSTTIPPAGVARLYLRTDAGATWLFAEITPDRIASNPFYGNSIAATAIETGAGRHLIKIDEAIPGNILPPINTEQDMRLEVAYDHVRPTVPDLSTLKGVPAGVFNVNLFAYKSQ